MTPGPPSMARRDADGKLFDFVPERIPKKAQDDTIVPHSTGRARKLDVDDDDIPITKLTLGRLKSDPGSIGTVAAIPVGILAKPERNPDLWNTESTWAKTKMGFRKNLITWRFVGDDNDRHEVKIAHSTVSGKRSIFVDNKLELELKLKLIDFGSVHNLRMRSGGPGPDSLLTLRIRDDIQAGFSYELLINGCRFYTARDKWLKG